MKCDRETNDRVLSTKTYYIYYIRVKFHRGSETEVKFQGEKGTLTINEECVHAFLKWMMVGVKFLWCLDSTGYI